MSKVVLGKKFLVGIDEAGRGPLAGPVAVGVVSVPADFNWKLIPGVGDSKQVSPKNRAAIFRRAKELREKGELDFVVILASAKEIDTQGIAPVIRNSIKKAISKLKLQPENCFIKLDGALSAPADFHQQTIIKGDQTELVIGLASICAKETRDAYMQRVSKKFPEYEFAVHKGYGTKRHRTLIFQYDLSLEHRSSYCQNRHRWGSV